MAVFQTAFIFIGRVFLRLLFLKITEAPISNDSTTNSAFNEFEFEFVCRPSPNSSFSVGETEKNSQFSQMSSKTDDDKSEPVE